MAKKRTSKCQHPHVQALQQEIDRLKSTQGTGLRALMRYKEFKQLAELLAEAHAQSVASDGSSFGSTGRGRLSPGESDGIVVLGEHIATPRYAVPQRKEMGVLAATRTEISKCVDRVRDIMDTAAPPRIDTRVRCGLSACPGRNRRQQPDIAFCGYCGRPLTSESLAG